VPGLGENGADSANSGSVRLSLVGILSVFAFMFVAVAVGLRIQTGVDLADESFYASFLVDWIREGIPNSTLITITQTAAVFVYPFALGFRLLNGSADGLVLFSRFLYLACSIATAALVALSLRHGLKISALFYASIVVAFVPFGLPAPSYNNFALQGLLVCCVVLSSCGNETGHRRLLWILLAGTAGAIATISYPSMLVPIAACLALGIWLRLIDARSVVAVVVPFIVVTGIVIAALSLRRLDLMIADGLTSPGGLDAGHRLFRIFGQLSADPRFLFICSSAIVVGVVRGRLSGAILAVAQGILMVEILLIPPPLFIASHVAVFVIALTGLGLAANLRLSVDPTRRAVAIIYAAGLIGGCVTTMTTSENGLFSFAIGGLPAALAALMPNDFRFVGRPSALVAPVCFLIVVLTTSLTFHYGEVGTTTARERIKTGWYAGIASSPEEAQIISVSTNALRPIAVVGWPVFYLTSPCVPRVLMAYPINDQAQHAVFQSTLRYYSDPKNLPEYVVEYDDRNAQFEFPFPDLHHFPDWYRLEQTYAMPFDGIMRVYKQRSQDERSP